MEPSRLVRTTSFHLTSWSCTFLVAEMKEIRHAALKGVVLHALDALSAFCSSLQASLDTNAVFCGSSNADLLFDQFKGSQSCS